MYCNLPQNASKAWLKVIGNCKAVIILWVIVSKGDELPTEEIAIRKRQIIASLKRNDSLKRSQFKKEWKKIANYSHCYVKIIAN